MAVDNIARGMAASALKNQGGGGSSLPIVNTATVGQTIRVSAVDDAGKPTEWEAVDMEGVPTVTTANNGQFLRVVNGAWAASTVPSAEEASF